MAVCAQKCGRLGTSTPCPLCRGRVCDDERCIDAHSAGHLMSKYGMTAEEAAIALEGPIGAPGEQAAWDMREARLAKMRS